MNSRRNKARAKLRWVARLESLETRQLLSNTFTVTSTTDSESPGTLRWAIGQVNKDGSDSVASPDRIEFNIPTSDSGYANGYWTVAPLNIPYAQAPTLTDRWPTLTAPVVVDGYTQPGSRPNSNGPGHADNAVLKIFLDGSKYVVTDGPGGYEIDGITLQADGSRVQGLAIGNFAGRFVISSDKRVTGGSGRPYGGSAAVMNGSGDVVAGCFLGMDPAGRVAADTRSGVLIQGGGQDTVGGLTPQDRNVIGGNAPPVGFLATAPAGIIVSDSTGDLVEGNFIGTDPTGRVGLANKEEGVQLLNAQDVTVGGTAPSAGNVISGNTLDGIVITKRVINEPTPLPSGNLIVGNLIGVALDGVTPLANNSGIDISGAVDTTIGGTAPGSGNVISGNTYGGIVIADLTDIWASPLEFTTTGTLVEGNFIGTDRNGTLAIGNGSAGVYVVASGAQTIGGTAAGAANVIANNATAGIATEGPETGSVNPPALPHGPVTISRNAIFANGSDSPVARQIKDYSARGIDGRQPAGPTITSVTSSGGSTVVNGNVAGAPNTSYTIEFFSTPLSHTGNGEGQTYMASITVATDADGNATLNAANATIPSVLATGRFLSATATNHVTGDTSQFSQTVGPLVLVESPSMNSPAPGDTLTLSFTVTNAGYSTNANVNADTGVVLKDSLPPRFVFVSSPDGTYDQPSGTFTAMLGALANGASKTVTMQVVAPVGGTFVDSSSATSDQAPFAAASAFAVFHVAGARAKGTTNTTLAADANPAAPGQPVTFTATVAGMGRAGIPTGDVVFHIDGQDHPAAIGYVNGVATATYVTTFIATGSHTVTASYAGDAAFVPSTSTGLTETIAGTPVTPTTPTYHRTFIVINTNDSGDGSLRAVIAASELDPGSAAAPNHIIFQIPETDPGKNATTGAFVIRPTAAEPAINSPTVVDAYTQHGSSPNTNPIDLPDNAVIRVQLDGSLAGKQVDGLDLHASDSALRGLSIVNFHGQEVSQGSAGFVNLGGVGIRVFGSRDVVAGDFLGVLADGLTQGGNDFIGVELSGPSNIVGGTANADRNVISNHGLNGGEGVVDDASAGQTVIIGNFIGTNATGASGLSTQVANAQNTGIALIGSGDRVGGETPAERNIISGNFYGISIGTTTNSSVNDQILGNYIGADRTGTAAVPNDSGIFVSNGKSSTIGGTTPAARNLISGNSSGGITFFDASASLIEGNYVGTDVTGTKSLASNGAGITLEQNGGPNTVGGTAPGAGNLISGNGIGIYMFANQASILDNTIGTSVDGDPLGNTTFGIYLSALSNGFTVTEASSNTIAGNVIAENAYTGVLISGGNTPPYEYGVGDALSRNSIYGNASYEIVLDSGVVQNVVPYKLVTGAANHAPNVPVLTSATVANGSTTILGTFDGLAGRDYTIELFASDSLDPSGNGEGQTFLGAVTVHTDASGHAPITAPFAEDLGGKYITATDTTANLVTGESGSDTSMFSASIFAPGRPSSAQPADLSVVASVVTANPIAGAPLTFKFVVANAGPGAASDATLVVTLPIDASAVSSTVGTVAGSVLTADLGTLPLGASKTITVTFTPMKHGTQAVTAKVSANEADADLSNNTSRAKTAAFDLPGLRTSGQTTATTLTASPNPSTFGQSVTLVAKITAAGAPVTAGTVAFFDGSNLLALLTLHSGAPASLVLPNLTVGTHALTAVYSAQATFAPSASPVVSEVVTATNPSPPPKVDLLQRYGFHAQPTILVLTFSSAPDAAQAQDPSNYQIVFLGGPAADGAIGRTIRIAKAVYDPATLRVILYPAERLNIHDRYRITAFGARPGGLTGSSGVGMGVDYVAAITRRSLVGGDSKVFHVTSKGQATSRRHVPRSMAR